VVFRVGLGHAPDLGQQAAIENLRHEAGADALDAMGPGRAARQHGAGRRLDADDRDVRMTRAQRPADAGDGAAGAHAGDEGVGRRPRELRQDLGPGRRQVHGGVGRVLELLGHEGARVGRRDRVGLVDGAAHDPLRRRQV
jgi:hypothetical protein